MKEASDETTAGSDGASDAICDGFLTALGEIAFRSAGERDQVRRRLAQLELEHGALISDRASVQNLRYGCAVLAAYEVLRARSSPARAVESLKAAFLQSGAWVREKTRDWLDRSPDAFRELVNISKQREAQAFGDGFTFERERDDDEQYLLNVHRCFWHAFFVRAGTPELTQVLCEFDRNWFEAIDEQRHGFRFQRATTLGLGGTHCPFHFVRLRVRSSSTAQSR